MSKLMNRAWEIYRGLEGDHRAKLSMAMKQAHKESKKVTLDAETIQEKLQAQGLKVARWTKNGMDRLYVKGFHYSKEYYIDLVNMIAKGNRPGTNSDIENHFSVAGLNIKIAI
jgi:hypothetical protein